MERTWFGYHWGKGGITLSEATQQSKRATADSPHAAPKRAATTIESRRSASSSSAAHPRQRMASRLQRTAHTGGSASSVNWPYRKSARDRCNKQIDQTTTDRTSLEAELAAQADRVAAETERTNSCRRDTQAAAIAAAQAELARTDRAQLFSTHVRKRTDAIQKATGLGRSPQSPRAIGRAPHTRETRRRHAQREIRCARQKQSDRHAA